MIKSFLRRLKRRFKRYKKPHIYKCNGRWWVIGKDNEDFRKAVAYIGGLQYRDDVNKVINNFKRIYGDIK